MYQYLLSLAGPVKKALTSWTSQLQSLLKYALEKKENPDG